MVSDGHIGQQFPDLSYQTITRRGPKNELQQRGVSLISNNESIGHLLWHHPSGEIADVVVKEEHRRKGLATNMLAKAREIEPKVHHSSQMTPDGVAWRQAMTRRQGSDG